MYNHGSQTEPQFSRNMRTGQITFHKNCWFLAGYFQKTARVLEENPSFNFEFFSKEK
jgi:hypothetical protein